MGQFVKETAHLNINQDKYNEGYERIFGKKEDKKEDDKEEKDCPKEDHP